MTGTDDRTASQPTAAPTPAPAPGLAAASSPWQRAGVALVATIVPLMLLALALPPNHGRWWNQKKNVIFPAAALVAAAAALAYVRPGRMFPRRRSTLPLIVLATALLLMATIIWNVAFRRYAGSHAYATEVFRSTMRNPWSPIYGQYDNALARPATLPFALLAAALAVAWYAWARRRPAERPWGARSFAALLSFQLALIASFALCEPWPTRASLNHAQYNEWQADFPTFARTDAGTATGTTVAAVLRDYVAAMPRLGRYGQHYPPGNLLLLTIEKNLRLPGLSHAVVVLLTMLSAVPLYLLSRELRLRPAAASAAIMLHAASSTVLIYCTINTTSLLLLPAVACAWALVRGLNTGSIAAAVLLGVCFAAYLFFSFSASILGLLMAATAAIGWLGGGFRTRDVVRTGAVSLVTVAASIALLYASTRFNLVACFVAAVHGHHAQQGNRGFDDAHRYLLRSTGNLIAYLISIVPLCILAASAVWQRRLSRHPPGEAHGMLMSSSSGTRAQAPYPATPAASAAGMPPMILPASEGTSGRAFFLALWATLLVASFSGLFYVETERIWIFLTPFFALAAGQELARRADVEGRAVTDAVVLLVLAISVTQELFFLHYR